MKEGVLYHILTEEVLNTRFKRIENRLEIGTLDTYFCNPLNRGWLEAKQLTLPKQSTTSVKIPFRPGQYGWIEDEVKHGGIVVLGIVTNVGYFFSIGRKIQQEYVKSDFDQAMTGEEGLLWFVDKKHMNWFFNSVPFCLE